MSRKFSVVYKNVQPGHEANKLTSDGRVAKVAWGDLMEQRDVLLNALENLARMKLRDPVASDIAQGAINRLRELQQLPTKPIE